MRDPVIMSSDGYLRSSSDSSPADVEDKKDSIDVDALIASAVLYFEKVVRNDEQERQSINEIISTVLTVLIGDILAKKNVEPIPAKKENFAVSIRKLLNVVISDLHSHCGPTTVET